MFILYLSYISSLNWKYSLTPLFGEYLIHVIFFKIWVLICNLVFFSLWIMKRFLRFLDLLVRGRRKVHYCHIFSFDLYVNNIGIRTFFAKIYITLTFLLAKVIDKFSLPPFQFASDATEYTLVFVIHCMKIYVIKKGHN